MIKRFLKIERYFIYQASLVNSVNFQLKEQPDLTFRELRESDFRSSLVFKEKDREHRYIHRLKQAHRCFGFVTPTSEVAYYMWVSSPLFGVSVTPFEARLSCRIPEQAAYLWDARTAESFRGHGLYTDGMWQFKRLCYEHGAERLYTVVQQDNIAAIRGHKASGFMIDHTMTVLSVLRR